MAVFFSDIYEVIDNLAVDGRWKQIFKKIYTVYYQNFSEGQTGNRHFWQPSPLISVLGIGDKWKFHCLFNFWALIFGPLYYIAKGLVTKGAILLAMYLAAIIIISTAPVFGETSFFLLPLINIYCAVLFNADYFIEKVAKSEAVKKEPRLFGDYVNEAYFDRVADNPKANIAPPIMATIVTLGIFLVCGFVIYTDVVSTLAVDGTQFPPVCQDDLSCNEKIGALEGKIRSENGGTSSLNYQLACAYSNKKDSTEAIKAAKEAIKKNNNNIEAYILLGNLYFNKQDYSASTTAFQRALKINGRIKNINFNIGRCYYRTRNYQEALKHFKIATSKYPCILFPQYFELQGYTKILTGDKLGGAKDLKSAKSSYEKFPEGPQRIGIIDQYLNANGMQ